MLTEPVRLCRDAERLRFTVPGPRGPWPGVVGPVVLTEPVRLCRHVERLHFAYRSHHGTATRRTVGPHRPACCERRRYRAARDPGREARHTFRVDRVTPRPPHGPRSVPRGPPAEDLAAYVSRASPRACTPRTASSGPGARGGGRRGGSPTDGVPGVEGPDGLLPRTGPPASTRWSSA
ncbi:WYL domain-containing protein [Streptomyces sp. NPDC085946]|uniref:WYL domain-containing protein n=1 Tax=Streptomyces sp. NPDC085946 TaxID=3365744 RepID=UPI0037CE3D68